MSRAKVLKWFQGVLSTPADKIFHNAMYDVCWIKALSLSVSGRIVDTMIASALVDENQMRYDLNNCAKRYTGKTKNESDLYAAAKDWGVDAKAEMYKLPAIYVGAYAEKDAEITLELWQELKKEILHQDIQSIFDMETELFPCLVDMRFLGVKVDVTAAHQLKKELTRKEESLLHQVKKETGVDTQIWAARSIAQVFDKLKLDYDRTEKTSAPSFTKNFLQNHPHPLVKRIAQAREINKAHTTFIDTILKHSHKGRIHAEINQYKCKDEPMCSLCDKSLCRTRKFGIGEEIMFPNLTDLQVIDLEDPYYYMNVDGQRLKLESVKHLRQQSLFQESCMVQLKFRPPTLKEKLEVLPRILPFLAIIAGVLYVLYGGVATPSEASGVGAFLVFVMIAVVYKIYQPKKIWNIVKVYH